MITVVTNIERSAEKMAAALGGIAITATQFINIFLTTQYAGYNQLIDGYSLDIKTIIESLTYVLQQYCRTRHKIRQGTPEMIYMIIRT